MPRAKPLVSAPDAGNGRAARAAFALDDAHLAHRVPVFTGQLGRDLDRVAGDLEALLGRAVAESAGMAP